MAWIHAQVKMAGGLEGLGDEAGDLSLNLTSLRSVRALAEEFDDGIGAVVDVEFLIDALDIGAHGAERHLHRLGNLLVRTTIS